MVKHYELIGSLLFKTLHWEQLLSEPPQVNSLEGPLMQNLLFKIHLGLDTGERKREEKAEELNLNKSTGYCGPAANIWASCL